MGEVVVAGCLISNYVQPVVIKLRITIVKSELVIVKITKLLHLVLPPVYINDKQAEYSVYPNKYNPVDFFTSKLLNGWGSILQSVGTFKFLNRLILHQKSVPIG